MGSILIANSREKLGLEIFFFIYIEYSISIVDCNGKQTKINSSFNHPFSPFAKVSRVFFEFSLNHFAKSAFQLSVVKPNPKQSQWLLEERKILLRANENWK